MIHEFEKAHAEKLVKVATCGGLRMFHYSETTVWERIWTPITRQARGIIFDPQGRVVARPFPKFFNLGEMPETQVDALPVEVPELSEKLDGSLAIVFWNPERECWQGTTKGSFDSEQARWINEKWIPKQAHEFDPRLTYLFELVAPWNRIVVPYPREEMILIGMVGTEDGYDWTYKQVRDYGEANGLRTVYYENRRPQDVDLADETIRDREGFVARYSNGLRVKLKFDQYKLLHKIITGLSVKGVWEAMAEGREIDLGNVPDEFMGWYTKIKTSIQDRFDAAIREAREAFVGVPTGCERKASALVILSRPQEVRPMLFSLLDGRDIAPLAWKRAKPEKHEVFREAEE